MPLYRAVSTSPDPEQVFLPKSPMTSRMPGNLPFWIDNLWEWVRMERYASYPSRRYAVFASPSPTEAEECAGKGSHAYRVEFLEPTSAVQTLNLVDARFHDDVRQLKGLITTPLQKSGWADRDAGGKEPEARLFTPCLSASEVAAVLQGSSLLRDVADKVLETSTFWNDVVPFDDGHPPSPSGEVFFIPASKGYRLVPLGQ